AREALAGDDADVARAPQAAEPLLELGCTGDAGDERRERRPEGAHVRAQKERTNAVPPAVRPEQQGEAAGEPEQDGGSHYSWGSDAIDDGARERTDADPCRGGDGEDDTGRRERQVRDLQGVDQLERIQQAP